MWEEKPGSEWNALPIDPIIPETSLIMLASPQTHFAIASGRLMTYI
jgi:hypothetical protein